MQGGSDATMSSLVMKLLSHAESLSKRPQLDRQLGDVLDQFMEHVRDSDTYLHNGIFNINFAEVALLLQNCAQVYGKKVDLLWDCVFQYQSEMIALERETAKREEAEQLAKERQLRYKRKRKFEETQTTANVTELLHLSATVQKSLSPCENLQKSWMYAQVRDRIYSQENVTAARDQFSLKGSEILPGGAINSDCENVIGYEKMRLNTTVFELSEKYPLFLGCAQGKNPLNVTHFYENDEVLQEFLVKEGLNYLEVEKICREKFRLFYSEHLAAKANSACAEAAQHTAQCPKRLMTHVKRLSEDVLQHYLKKDPVLISAKIKRASSTAPSLGDSGFYDYSGVEEEPTEENTTREDVTLSLSSTENSLNAVQENACENLNGVGESNCEVLNGVEESNCEVSMEVEGDSGDLDAVEGNCEDLTSIAEENFEKVAPVEQEGAEKTVVEEVKERCVKRKRQRDLSEERCNRKKRKKELVSENKTRRSLRLRPRSKITVPLKEFEDFMAKNYKPEEGEGSIEIPAETIYAETTISDVFEAPTTPSALEVESEATIDPKTTLDEICETSETPSSLEIHPATTTTDDDVVCEEAASPIEVLVLEELETGSVSDCDENTQEVNNNNNENENNNSKETEKTTPSEPPIILNHSIMKRLDEEKKQREKVEEWKSFIEKKLDKLNEKSDFDIHYYGSQIMDNLCEQENKKFGHVVAGKTSSEVCRYFLATLQLACTENVEIVNESGGGTVSNDSLELKLLSRECYHENLGSYMAPSEESFEERLQRARRRRQ